MPDNNRSMEICVNKIIKITIEYQSCWGCIDDAWMEKLTIRPNQIEYIYKPRVENEHKSIRRWIYKTNSLIFLHNFDQLSKAVQLLKSENTEYICDDMPVIITLHFEDKTKQRYETYYICKIPGLIDLIKSMIPKTECMPIFIDGEDFDEG